MYNLSSLDLELFLELNSWHTPWLNSIMVFFSSQLIWLPLIAMIFFMAIKQLTRKEFFIFVLFFFLAIIASDVTSSYILKNVFERLRPCRVPEIKDFINNFGQKCGGRFGFVSSHAANSLCIITFSFILLKFKSKKYHFLWILPLLIGYSRIYLGVHYPGDILGGFIVGGTWASILAVMFKSYQLRSKTI
jgi:undecaprenyl-diphosphatase